MLAIWILFFCLYLILTWKNFRWAVFLLVVLLPAYLLRLDLGPLPSTALELAFIATALIWLVRYVRKDLFTILSFLRQNKWLTVFLVLFFIASVIGIFVSDMVIKSLGQWRAYFLEPMVLSLILIGRREEIGPRDLLWALAVSTLSISVYSVVQAYTGWGIATAEWTNEATRRVTAFYTSPNAVGLYLGPAVLLMAGLLWSFFRSLAKKGPVLDVLDPHFHKDDNKNWLLLIILLLALAAVYFTKSQGTWIGLGAGLLVFIYLAGYKKVAACLAVAGVAASFLIPSMRSAVLFEKKSDQNRLTLWSYSWNYLKASPNNFIFGTGIRQFFRKIQKPFYNDVELERLIYPHNIFLNFWTETGLLGMLSFAGIFFYSFWTAWKIQKKDLIMGAALLGALVVILVHGLVDVPYFKNDLAMYFWILMAVIFMKYENLRQGKTERL